jgi:L-methionine (R)-S-oxide reductase
MSNPTPLPADLRAALQTHSYEQVLTAALAHFGCQAGTIHLLHTPLAGGEAAQPELRLEASIGIPPQVVALVQTVPIGKGIAGLAAERREPITICNLQTDDSGQARPAARTTGMEGSLAVPMLDEAGELRGVLGIAKATAYDWPEEEAALVQALGRALCTFAR